MVLLFIVILSFRIWIRFFPYPVWEGPDPVFRKDWPGSGFFEWQDPDQVNINTDPQPIIFLSKTEKSIQETDQWHHYVFCNNIMKSITQNILLRHYRKTKIQPVYKRQQNKIKDIFKDYTKLSDLLLRKYAFQFVKG